MARLAVFASGTGSNFVAMAAAVKAAHRHAIEFLLCDVAGAPVLDRAKELGVPTVLRELRRACPREAVEKKMVRHLERRAGGPGRPCRLHEAPHPVFPERSRARSSTSIPASCPKYPGAHAIEESFASGDKELGISVIRVDEGVDTGPVLLQKSFTRDGTESCAEIEAGSTPWSTSGFPGVLEMLDRDRRPADPHRGAAP